MAKCNARGETRTRKAQRPEDFEGPEPPNGDNNLAAFYREGESRGVSRLLTRTQGFATDSATDSRWCPRCQTGKPVSEFGRCSRPGQPYQPYCKPCKQAWHKEWRATAHGNAKWNAAMRVSKARYPEREEARRISKAAIRAGKLIPGPCCLAGEGECRGRIEAHHDDYSRPLAVRWTCRHHHTRLDQQRRAKEAA